MQVLTIVCEQNIFVAWVVSAGNSDRSRRNSISRGYLSEVEGSCEKNRIYSQTFYFQIEMQLLRWLWEKFQKLVLKDIKHKE